MLAGYVRVPKFLLEEDRELGTDVLIHLPENKTVVFFRGKGDRLTAKDCEKLAKLPHGALLAPEVQREELTKWMSRGVTRVLEIDGVQPSEPLNPVQLQ